MMKTYVLILAIVSFSCSSPAELKTKKALLPKTTKILFIGGIPYP